jgi:hypothetical protein
MWEKVLTLQRLSVGVCSTPGRNKVGKGQTQICTRLKSVPDSNLYQTQICTRLSTVKENNAAE